MAKQLLDSISINVSVSNNIGVPIILGQAIYFKHSGYYDSSWPLEGEVLGSGIQEIEILIGWLNGLNTSITGHIEATATRPDGTTVAIAVTKDQDTTLVMGESVVVNLMLPINWCGSWQVTAKLSDANTGVLYDSAVANFVVGVL